MTNEELELNIKERVSSIKAPRKQFESTIKIVTDDTLHRYNHKKESIPSPYNLINNYFMKKNILIGVPLIALVLIAVIGFKKTPSEIGVNNVGDNRIAVSDKITNENKVTSLTYAKEDLSSIDTIVASFNSDATAETTINTNESVEEQSLLSDLADYNNLKTYTYDDTTI